MTSRSGGRGPYSAFARVRREDAEHFHEDVRGGDAEIAAKLRIVERELPTGGLN